MLVVSGTCRDDRKIGGNIQKKAGTTYVITTENAFPSKSGFYYYMHVALRVAYSLHPAYPHALSARRLGIIELPTVTPLFVLYLSRLFYTCHIALHRNTSSLSILSVCALISFRCCGENPEKVDIDLLAHQPMSLTGSDLLAPKFSGLPTGSYGVSRFDEAEWRNRHANEASKQTIHILLSMASRLMRK